MTTPPPPDVCKFPVEIDEVGEIVKHGIDLDGGGSRPGRRGDYCEQLVTDPDGVARQHTRTIAFARRRELQAAGVAGWREVASAQEARELAEGAAQDALEDRDGWVAEAEQHAEAAHAEASQARAELEQARAESTRQVAAAQQREAEQVTAAH